MPADGGRHLVFLGDVTGKGIEAAALTSLVRHSVRTAARFDTAPGGRAALVNDILRRAADGSRRSRSCARSIEGEAR